KAADEPPAELASAPELVDERVDAEIGADTPATLARGDDDGADAIEEVPALTDEEQQLAAVYGEDLARPAIAHAEFSDRQTRDEDRPMMPEINAREERKQQWQERRDRRKQRRDERQQRREQREQFREQGEHRSHHEPRVHDARQSEPRPSRP